MILFIKEYLSGQVITQEKINEAEIRRDAMLAKEDLVQQGKIREQAQKTVDRQLDQTQQIIQNVTNGSQQTGE